MIFDLSKKKKIEKFIFLPYDKKTLIDTSIDIFIWHTVVVRYGTVRSIFQWWKKKETIPNPFTKFLRSMYVILDNNDIDNDDNDDDDQRFNNCSWTFAE